MHLTVLVTALGSKMAVASGLQLHHGWYAQHLPSRLEALVSKTLIGKHPSLPPARAALLRGLTEG